MQTRSLDHQLQILGPALQPPNRPHDQFSSHIHEGVRGLQDHGVPDYIFADDPERKQPYEGAKHRKAKPAADVALQLKLGPFL